MSEEQWQRHVRTALNAAVMSERVTLPLRVADVKAMLEALDDARAWVRRMHHDSQTVTCVYCGLAYPPGTPTSGAEALTAHIRICERHPLRAAEAAMRHALDVLREETAGWTQGTARAANILDAALQQGAP